MLEIAYISKACAVEQCFPWATKLWLNWDAGIVLISAVSKVVIKLKDAWAPQRQQRCWLPSSTIQINWILEKGISPSVPSSCIRPRYAWQDLSMFNARNEGELLQSRCPVHWVKTDEWCSHFLLLTLEDQELWPPPWQAKVKNWIKVHLQICSRFPSLVKLCINAHNP